MNNGQPISITLSPAQVDQVVRAAAQGTAPSFSALISTTLNTQRLEAHTAARASAAAGAIAGSPEDPRKSTRPAEGASGDATEDIRSGEDTAGDAAQGAEDETASPAVIGKGYFPSYEDARLSRSLLRGLSILTCFGPENTERGIIELAGQLGMSPSTTHRYVATLVELGLLERSPRSRKYRLASVPAGNGAST